MTKPDTERPRKFTLSQEEYTEMMEDHRAMMALQNGEVAIIFKPESRSQRHGAYRVKYLKDGTVDEYGNFYSGARLTQVILRALDEKAESVE